MDNGITVEIIKKTFFGELSLTTEFHLNLQRGVILALIQPFHHESNKIIHLNNFREFRKFETEKFFSLFANDRVFSSQHFQQSSFVTIHLSSHLILIAMQAQESSFHSLFNLL